MKSSLPNGWRECFAAEVFDRVVNTVDVDRHQLYQEIGIRSHGKGLFKKPPVRGAALGNKRVYWVEPDCLILNIVFAWEQAVARTTTGEKGLIASHRFPMFRPKNDEVDLDFVLYFLKSKWGRKLLEIGSPGGAGRNKTLSQKEFGDLRLRLPPLPEQQRIAGVLQCWEQAINQTRHLLEAQRSQRKALRQKLFLGLPKKPFLEAASVTVSGVDKKSRSDETPVLLCNYVDVFRNSRITSKLAFMHATASAREIAKCRLYKHDVVFTKDSETPEEIAEPALIAEDIDDLICGYHLAIARPRQEKAYGPFITQAMRHPEVRWQFRRLANGVVRFGLTVEAIEAVEIFLPEMRIQQYIADTLDTEDQRIEALAERIELMQSQRQALMQKLLSGKWRLDQRFDPPEAAMHVPEIGAAWSKAIHSDEVTAQ